LEVVVALWSFYEKRPAMESQGVDFVLLYQVELIGIEPTTSRVRF
jgi:hypothetical protein